jgi:RTX calcium-binding nonapeptide repeat (4 copies)
LKRWLLLITSAALLLTVVNTVAGAAQERRRPLCHGERATIVGTNRADVLVGTRRGDVVVGKGGNDVIVVSGGNDVICAGGGDDIVDGAEGRDHTWGGPGIDMCTASTGREHRLHHQCEHHQGAPLPGTDGPSGSAMTQSRLRATQPIVRAHDICYGSYCDYFYAGSIESLGFGVPHCNNFTGEVDFLRLNVAAQVEYAVKMWFQVWNGTGWEWFPYTPDHEIGNTYGLPDDQFTSFQYDFLADNHATFRIWYEGWLRGQQGQWLGPTFTTYRGYILKGPQYGSANSTFCIT